VFIIRPRQTEAERAYFEMQIESWMKSFYIVGFPFATAPTTNTTGWLLFSSFANLAIGTNRPLVDSAIFTAFGGRCCFTGLLTIYNRV
jgi:hypothetical protein